MRTFCTYPNLFRALDDVETPEGIQPSNFKRFKGANIGRDNVQVGLDLNDWLPSLTDRIIFSLARLRGKHFNKVNEQEPGKFHHEYRRLYFGGVHAAEEQVKLLHQLSERFGGDDESFIYYGSIDVTPQFIRLVAQRARRYGADILQRRYQHLDGETELLGDAFLAGIGFVVRKIEESDLGLLEFMRKTPEGFWYQALRDGRTAYMHEDGTLANHEAPIASLDVQGLAYDALLDAAELFPDHPDRGRWVELAKELRRQTLERFWLTESNFFAMAIDRDAAGKPRLVRTATSISAELLETRLFDGLPQDQTEAYVSGIVRELFSDEFLTPVGVRMRALRYAGMLPYADYQGSLVSWVITSNIFARGLRRQMLLPLGEEIELGYVRGTEISRMFLEYWPVDAYQRVAYLTTRGSEPSSLHFVQTNQAEQAQAWTVSAILRAMLAQEEARPEIKLPAWKRRLLVETEEWLAETRRAFIALDLGRALEQKRFE